MGHPTHLLVCNSFAPPLLSLQQSGQKSGPGKMGREAAGRPVERSGERKLVLVQTVGLFVVDKAGLPCFRQEGEFCRRPECRWQGPEPGSGLGYEGTGAWCRSSTHAARSHHCWEAVLLRDALSLQEDFKGDGLDSFGRVVI